MAKRASTIGAHKKVVGKAAVLKQLEEGSSIIAACEATNVPRRSFYNWMNDDPDFQGDVFTILNGRTTIVEDALFGSALRGNVTAQIFWLCNRGGGRWRHVQQLEHKVVGETLGKIIDKLNDLPEELLPENDGDNGNGGNGQKRR